MGDSNYQKLPPGWDCKYDQATGNCYYINYFTKAMQLEDPRMRYKQLQNERCSTESIPLQSMHVGAVGSGSPYHVYPSNNLPAMRAFQTSSAANSTLQNISSSPLLSSRGQLEMSPLPFARSITPRPMAANMSRRSTIQETSFTNQIETDAVVTKIQNMFPTAGENHIRLLLKRYYNREAVVISALQVEKHPVTMPGPFVTPPAQRHLFHSNSALLMTPPARRPDLAAGAAGRALGWHYGGNSSRTASPVPAALIGARYGSVASMQSGNGRVAVAADGSLGYAPAAFHAHGSPRFTEQWRSSPKPHSSPKMKLRYMKNIFPKADEMLLLDILAGADNNVQKASEQLIALGYVKRDFVPPKISNRPDANGAHKKPEDVQILPLRPKEYTPAEKEALQLQLKEKYPQIAERIILMALESVSYAEDRAVQILQIVHEEDETRARKHAADLQLTGQQNETVVDGMVASSSSGVGVNGAADSSILAVVLETTATATTSAAGNPEHSNKKAANTTPTTAFAAKKRTFPSINVTTPTTATTQIILSNSPICIEAENTAKPPPQPTTTTTAAVVVVQGSSSNRNNNNNNANIITSSSTTTPLSSSSSHTLITASPTATASASSSFQTLTTKSILARSQSNAFGGAGGINSYLHGTSANSTTNSISYSSASILEKLKLSSSCSSSSRPRDKTDSLKNSQRDSIEEEVDHLHPQEFKSLLGRISTMGHNGKLARGADENLLLADYVTWNGANPDISLGPKQASAALGPDAKLLSSSTYTPHGRNSELCKGAKVGLAKGSIYACVGGKSANIKCN